MLEDTKENMLLINKTGNLRKETNYKREHSTPKLPDRILNSDGLYFLDR